MRQCIERAFALLVKRWGILWRPILCDYSRWTLVLTVCAKLHNLCINKDIPIHQHRYYQDNRRGDNYDVFLSPLPDETNGEDIPRRVAFANRRTEFARELQDKGIRRPVHAEMNSRA